MSLWYWFCDFFPFEMLRWDFMKNAMLALLLMAPLFGLMSTMIVTGRMSFFSDALGHSAFTGIAIGAICGMSAPTWAAVLFSVVFALIFSYVRSRSNQAADTLIGVFSSTAVALGIFIATLGGGSFTKYNKYLIGDILSVTPGEIGLLALVLMAVLIFWVLCANRLTLTAIHPQLASSRGIPVGLSQTLFTVAIAVVVTLSISSVSADSELPDGAARGIRPECLQKSAAVPWFLRSVCAAGWHRRADGVLLSGLFRRCGYQSDPGGDLCRNLCAQERKRIK